MAVAKAKYLDFEEYSRNDKKYFVRILKDELHSYQTKIVFLDGSSYNVTKGGSRYWRYVDFDGNYVGFMGEHKDGYQYWYCFLNGRHYDNRRDFRQAVHFLTE